MEHQNLLDFMSIAEKLKCNTRHSWTSSGRHESVAEHTFRLGIFAWLVKDEPEFAGLDMDRIMKMCLFHDLGEALTGDIPAFEKNDSHRLQEDRALDEIADTLPETHHRELTSILQEMKEEQTPEAKLFQCLDKLEAVIQHNEASIETWLPLEYDLQLTYGADKVQAFSYMKQLQEYIKQQTLEKIQEGI